MPWVLGGYSHQIHQSNSLISSEELNFDHELKRDGALKCHGDKVCFTWYNVPIVFSENHIAWSANIYVYLYVENVYLYVEKLKSVCNRFYILPTPNWGLIYEVQEFFYIYH